MFGNILIVDDEPNAIKVLSSILTEEGYTITEATDGEQAIKMVREKDFDAIITDLKMPGKDGMELFEYASENYPDIPIIFLTAYGTVDSAVYAVIRGAFYYFIKPPDYQKLLTVLAKAVEKRKKKAEFLNFQQKVEGKNYRKGIIGQSPEMIRISDTIDKIKNSMSSVLICGETGTGKELVARTLYHCSSRCDKPFMAVNCAAIPRELMEAELFGHEKGAFTGAQTARIGKFEEAQGGIIFLDEIGELELSLQAKLLRVLQEREIERIGSNRKIPVDFRLVSSTNRDLKKEVRSGNFREDLFYRINVVQINMPPLRERMADIPLFVTEFINEIGISEKKMVTVSDDVMECFRNYHWPGNIRQLRNVIERIVVLSKGNVITAKELPKEFQRARKQNQTKYPIKTLRELELQALRNALDECNGNKTKAARALGISRKALYKKMNDLNFHNIV